MAMTIRSPLTKRCFMINMAILVGIWTTTCIQTQIANVNQGFMKETYIFEETGSYEYTREWFHDSKCITPKETESESGMVEIGPKLQGIFLPDNTFEANFNSQAGVDLGALNVSSDKHIRVSRGVINSNLRNLMLSLFEFKKTN
jgi:hypothetical protein